jgi:hypothetical protein
MKKISIVAVLVLIVLAGISSVSLAIDWREIKRGAEEVLKGKRPLSNDEVIRGLKEALSIGSENAGRTASKIDGFYRNPRIKIPFPPEAQKVKDLAETLGLESQVEKFVMTLNRAAEEAAKQAAPIFLDAIKGLTIQDGFNILNGPNDAATSYLKGKTSSRLRAKFTPIVKDAIDKVQVTKYWKPLSSKYNAVPGVTPVNPNLDAYVTERAIRGLFKLVASEEKKIRADPAARVTELLKRVFGSREK